VLRRWKEVAASPLFQILVNVVVLCILTGYYVWYKFTTKPTVAKREATSPVRRESFKKVTSSPEKHSGIISTAEHSFVESIRKGNETRFLNGLKYGWGVSEVKAFRQKINTGATRVVAIRHGMGHHNDVAGLYSFHNRDADLNRVGIEEATLVGEHLREHGILGSCDNQTTPLVEKYLLVISPFRRTIQTAINIMGSDSWSVPTVIEPLAAEHTFRLAAVQQGDKGSDAKKLREWFPLAKHPQLDFTPLDEYCTSKNIKEGKWWHHSGEMGYETQEHFAGRAKDFRFALLRHAVAHKVNKLIVISHGGLLTAAFDSEEYDNCEFRCFDIATPYASFVRPLQKFHILSVEQVRVPASPSVSSSGGSNSSSSSGKGNAYLIKGSCANGTEWSRTYKLSYIREQLHDKITIMLQGAYRELFPTKFPGSALYWTQLEAWLKCLCVAIDNQNLINELETLFRKVFEFDENAF